MEFDLNSKTKQREAQVERVLQAIDQGCLLAKAAKPRRDYLGGSYVGGACERAVQYQYMQTPVDPGAGFPPKILRVFQRGHAMEEMAAEWLRGSGFVLKTEDRHGRQFGFSAAGGRFRGHADGVLVEWRGEGESPISLPALWENKAVNAKTFERLVSRGVKKVTPVYYGQVVMYMHYLQLEDNPALFTAINANTMELHAELVPFDPAECQRLIDRAARVIQATEAGDLLPRGMSDPACFDCTYCDFKVRCWE